MMADKNNARPRRWALLGAVALSLAASGALAQGPPGGGPPGGLPPGGPPPGAGPGGPPGGGPPADGAAAFGIAPPEEALTPAQALVKAAGATPGAGGMGLFPFPKPLPDMPMPGSDPRDIQGTWIHNQPLEFRMDRDMYGKRAPYTMKGAEVLARRIKGDQGGKPYTNPSAKCRPPAALWQLDLNMPFSIYQSKDWIEFVFEEYHGRWQIVMNPAAAPPPAEKSYMGYSTGRWDGSTLVVETTGFKQANWLDVGGTPLSADGKLIHRIRKVDNGDRQPLLEVITTIDDPTYYTNPWSVVRSFQWNLNLTVFKEYNCEEQIGDRSVDADAGLVPEPKE